MRADPTTIEDAAQAGYIAHLIWRTKDGWGYPPQWENESPAVHDYWRKVAQAILTTPEPTNTTYTEDAGQ